MINFGTLTLKNFLSVGAVTQVVSLEGADLTLVLGANLDLGGDGSGARNGCGKSTILQALHYVLFNQSIGNTIRKDNLINKTNERGMLVTLTFSVGDTVYELRRGRKPGILQFLVNGKEVGGSVDTAQGESRETQREIERILNLTPELFTQLTLLSTYTTPFLALKSNEQRSIIESLLGISQLSERAESIKESIRLTRDEISAEEHRITATVDANKRITEQIEALRRRQRLWESKKTEDIDRLQKQLDELEQVDIQAELAAHRSLAEWNKAHERWTAYTALVAKQTAWKQKYQTELTAITAKLEKLSAIDIDAEIAAHQQLAAYNTAVKDHAVWAKALEGAKKEVARVVSQVDKLSAEIIQLRDHRCYACGQEFHDAKHAEVLKGKEDALAAVVVALSEATADVAAHEADPVVVPAKPTTHYATEAAAFKHRAELDSVKQALAAKLAEEEPWGASVLEAVCEQPGAAPVTVYDTEELAYGHRSTVESLRSQHAIKCAEADPYSEGIADMQTGGLVDISYDHLNQLNHLHDHQKFLHDLLTNKDSFVRKRIIDQNLAYLNTRLGVYLDRLRLAHTVRFKNNLEVDIQEFGRELDFGNLSRGEQNRVILALSFAFRDLYEALFHGINGLYVDELIDSGMDTSGVECSVGILKEMSRSGRSVFLISHREELTGRVGRVLRAVKEGGFTTYEAD